MTDQTHQTYRMATVGFAAAGNSVGWMTSGNVGIVATVVTAVGLAVAGAYTAIASSRLKAYKEHKDAEIAAYRESESAKIDVDRERIALEAERDKVLGTSISRELKEARRQRDALQQQLSAIQAMQVRTSSRLENVENAVVKKKRILVVEDSPEVSRIMVRYLQSINYEAEFVDSVEGAIEALAKGFDWALLDIELPGGRKGWEVLQHIHDQRIATKVAVVSGLSATSADFLANERHYKPEFVLGKPIQYHLLDIMLRDPAERRPKSDDSIPIPPPPPSTFETDPDIATIPEPAP